MVYWIEAQREAGTPIARATMTKRDYIGEMLELQANTDEERLAWVMSLSDDERMEAQAQMEQMAIVIERQIKEFMAALRQAAKGTYGEFRETLSQVRSIIGGQNA